MDTKRTGVMPAKVPAATLRVGWFPSAVYPDGTPVAGVMAVHEFGSPKMKIPPRAPMRITQAARKNEWDSQLSKLSERAVAGKMTMTQALNVLGMLVAGDVQKTIGSTLPPPLSARTLYTRQHRAQKNSSTQPLVDTRVAFNTLTLEVSL